jgi:predicted enzyme related to lactoylglutathione lyase
MSSARFVRFELRTTAVAAAAEFYRALLGRRVDEIVALPPMAAERGAPAHWIGYLDVAPLGGVEQLLERWLARGATLLGPPRAAAGESALLRDPGGAIVALTNGGVRSAPGVVWHQLNTKDAPRAAANYVELCGWALTSRLELGSLGAFQQFGWSSDEASVGVIADVAGRPHVHTHWLFHFAVSALDRALAVVRERGGLTIGPIDLPDGMRIAVCDDPQGAAFGLIESGSS